eukprot:PRCOL_00006178-RA
MVRRTAAQVAHRLTVHLSNRYVRAQVATRGDGRVVAAATSIERPLREAWDNTADRHAARRIGALLGERLREAVGPSGPLTVEYGPSQAQRQVEGHVRRRVPIKVAALLDGVREAGVSVHTPPKRW